MKLDKAKITDRRLDLNTYNSLIENANKNLNTDDTINQQNGVLSANLPIIKEQGFEVRLLGGSTFRVKLGSLFAGSEHLKIDFALTGSYHSTSYYIDPSQYGLTSDYIVYDIPASKYSANENYIDTEISAPTANGKKTIYVVVGIKKSLNTPVCNINGFGDTQDAYIFVTNDMVLANQYPTTSSFASTQDGKNILEQIASLHKTIAEIDIYSNGDVAEIRQVHVGDINLGHSILDSNGWNATLAGFTNDIPNYTFAVPNLGKRCTVEFNPENAQCGVTQLVNSDTVPQFSNSIPYLDSTGYETINGKCVVGGELKWVSPDTHYCCNCYNDFSDSIYQSTIEINDTGIYDHTGADTEKRLQLANVDEILNKKYAIATLQAGDGTPAKVEMEYVYPDSYLTPSYTDPSSTTPACAVHSVSGCVGNSIEITQYNACCKTLGIYDFGNPTSVTPCCTEDKILIRRVGGDGHPCVAYVDFANAASCTVCCFDCTTDCSTNCYDCSCTVCCLAMSCHHDLAGASTEYDDHGGCLRVHSDSCGVYPGEYIYPLLGSGVGCTCSSAKQRNLCHLYLGCSIYVHGVAEVCGWPGTDITPGTYNTGNLQVLNGGASVQGRLQACCLMIGTGSTTCFNDTTIQLSASTLCSINNASNGVGITSTVGGLSDIVFVNGIAVSNSAGGSLSGYLTEANAESTYLTIANAAAEYATIGGTLSIGTAADTYVPYTGACCNIDLNSVNVSNVSSISSTSNNFDIIAASNNASTLFYSNVCGTVLNTLALNLNGTNDVAISGAYYLPNYDGVGGQFLTTDGVGNASWDDVPNPDLTPYLTISNAASTYETIANASSTYLTISNAASYAKLDGTNQPFTGVIDIENATQNVLILNNNTGSGNTDVGISFDARRPAGAITSFAEIIAGFSETADNDNSIIGFNNRISGTSRVRAMTIKGGSVGIGTTAPTVALEVNGRSIVGTSAYANSQGNFSTTYGGATGSAGINALTLESTQTAGVGVGPSLIFVGKTGNSTASYNLAGIKGIKASATAGDYSGSLAFLLQNAGGGSNLVEGMRLTATGLGIGTTAPTARLDILATTGDLALRMYQQNDQNYYYTFKVDSAVNGTLSLLAKDGGAGSEYTGLTQTRLGYVGINTTTFPSRRLGILFEVDNSANYGGASFGTWSATADHAAILELNRSKSNTIGTHAALASGDRIGTWNNRGSDGASFIDGASIAAYVDGTVSTGNMPSRLVFLTSSASSPNQERMRITSAGNVGIGVTSPTAVLHLKAGTATASTAPLKFTSGTLLTSAEAGAVEFLTDKYYGTITTGTARKEIALLDAAGTVGSVYFAGTNGRITQDNANFFWDDTNNRLGIGTTAPVSQLNVISPSNTVSPLQLETYSSAATPNTLLGRAARGTYASPTATQSGDRPLALVGSSYGGTTWVNHTAINLYADETQSESARGSYITFDTTTNGATARAERMRVDNAGNVGIGTTAAARLHSLSTTEQLRLGYDASNYLSATIGSTGRATLALTGTNPTFTFSNSIQLPYVAKTANYTLTAADYTVDCTANTFTITLPTAVGITGRIYNVNNSGTGVITVDANGSQTINGELTQEVLQHENMQLQSTGSNWIIL
jgi:hypothetical protein